MIGVALVPKNDQLEKVSDQLVQAKRYLDQKGIDHNITNFESSFCDQLDTRAIYGIIPCYYGWLGIVVNTDGEVYPCCRCYEPVGNLNTATFDDIWNSENYQNFRKEASRLNKQKTSLNGCSCNSCIHYIANLKVYKALHPIKGKSSRIGQAAPAGFLHQD